MQKQLLLEQEYPPSLAEQAFLWDMWSAIVDMEAQAQGRDRDAVEAELAETGVALTLDGETVTFKPDRE